MYIEQDWCSYVKIKYMLLHSAKGWKDLFPFSNVRFLHIVHSIRNECRDFKIFIALFQTRIRFSRSTTLPSENISCHTSFHNSNHTNSHRNKHNSEKTSAYIRRHYSTKILYFVTNSKITWLFIGSVLIWHMYCPLSSSCTFLICKFHVVWSLCDTDTLGLCVMTWSCMACMAFVSALTHPTWKNTWL